ncbi:hypothetical protein [Streptomyces sp. NBC_00140]|uniref:hypothetical protein n=1 Tax=Streptomyces sp. NBC_00140 TaxID=2975664 RepID=UPI00225608CD|nr:hypothetical protein [Streptomyces sp. NBC_00140]MCX5332165.1 hypothetical protein [Streptomyces sp. NBC_00140]
MTDHPETFLNHLRTAAVGVLERIPEQLKPEIYTLAFNIWRVDYDYRHPYVDIGYNTESQYRLERRPEDPGEARWNYACWILEGFEKLGNVPEDPAGRPVYEAEVKQLGAWFDSEDEEDEGEIDAKSDLLRLHFYDAVIDLARHLHADGVIEKTFGRPIPVVVFDMDCPGWEVHATEYANPPGVIEEFMAWQQAQLPGS